MLLGGAGAHLSLSTFAEEADPDLATMLAREFETWFQTLKAATPPRAFTGVTQAGRQAVVVLNGLPFDHVQRREFLIWLCRMEHFIAYAYGTHVAIADETDPPKLSEGIDIYASSDHYDVSVTFGIERLTDEEYRLHERHRSVEPAGSDNGLFFALHRSAAKISDDNSALFKQIWSDLKLHAMWRQRQISTYERVTPR